MGPSVARARPPPTPARVLSPILSLAIVLVLISGITLIPGPSSIHRTALDVHTVSFHLALLLIPPHLAIDLTKASGSQRETG